MKHVPKNSIHIHDGEKLRQAWEAHGSQYCAHQHVAVESTESGYATGLYVCKKCGARKCYGDSPAKKNRMSPMQLTAAFLGGAFIGAIVTALTTPEGWSVVRRRFSGGTRNLRTQVPQLISDSRKAYGALGKDARQTFRQTVSRFTTVITTCVKSVKKNATRS